MLAGWLITPDLSKFGRYDTRYTGVDKVFHAVNPWCNAVGTLSAVSHNPMVCPVFKVFRNRLALFDRKRRTWRA
jgi:hypothetical protein